jgi:MATE family multidrug resistance protein
VGQLGKNELASAALATVWFNLWNATMIGFMTATDTLLSQSYGANRLDNFSAWTANSLVIIVPVTAVVSCAVALCGPCMKLFGQDPDLADEAAKFSYRLIPGLFPYYLFKVQTKYLQSQNRLAPGAWIGLFANGFNALFNWFLIYGVGWGLMGAPWATSLTRLVEFLLISLYMCANRRSLKDTWPIFSRENLRHSVLKPFWKLAISGALGFAAEAWSFEVTTILAGLLGTVPLDAHTITLTFATFIYLSFPYAVGMAASIRVGQLIGDQKPSDAKRSAHTSYFLDCIIQLILIAIIWPCGNIIGKIFSSDEDVQQLVSQLIPISCIFMMGDSIQSINSGGEFIYVLFVYQIHSIRLLNRCSWILV